MGTFGLSPNSLIELRQIVSLPRDFAQILGFLDPGFLVLVLRTCTGLDFRFDETPFRILEDRPSRSDQPSLAYAGGCALQVHVRSPSGANPPTGTTGGGGRPKGCGRGLPARAATERCWRGHRARAAGEGCWRARLARAPGEGDRRGLLVGAACEDRW